MINANQTLFALFLCIALAPFGASAQKEPEKENVLLHPDKFYRKFLPHLRIKRVLPDSNYIKVYPNYFSVGMHVLSPAIGVNINARRGTAPGNMASDFKTNIADVLGFSANYRFLSFGFAFLLKSGINTHDNYAPSRYRTATIKYSGTSLALQFKYLRIIGFTDIDQPFGNPAGALRRRADMVNKEFQFESVYNPSWKKYSYAGPLNFSQRQIRSRAAFLLKGGIYYNQLSGDSALIDKHRQKEYDDFNDVTTIRSLTIRIAPGFGANVVLYKRLCFSVSGFASYDFYDYKYLRNHDENISARQAFIFVLDGKASLGYQSERFYAGLRFEAERRAGILHAITINTVYTYTGIELGYRFNAPKFVRKVYKKTMPPGM